MNKANQKFVFQQYGAPAVESWKRFKCGEDFHCIQGKEPRGDWPKSKKTLCNRPAVNFHTDICFGVIVEVQNNKVVVVDGGIPYEERKPSDLIKELCPKCVSRIKKLACQPVS
jgi:hypothetical protein